MDGLTSCSSLTLEREGHIMECKRRRNEFHSYFYVRKCKYIDDDDDDDGDDDNTFV
jgi:hypothetical protein